MDIVVVAFVIVVVVDVVALVGTEKEWMVYTHTFAARMKKNTAITAEVIRSCWIDRQVVMESLVI
jgi:hypothetical protein